MFSKRLLVARSITNVRCYKIPTTCRKIIPVYPAVESKPDPLIINRLSELDLFKLDPHGTRRNLISKHNEERIKAGDIVRIIYDRSKSDYDDFIGYVLSVDRKKLVQDASLLLRNFVNKTAVEMRIPLFSPLIERIDLIRRADSKRRRNKHYYIRGTRLDVSDLDAGMRKKN